MSYSYFFAGKNPVQLLHEKFQDIEYEFKQEKDSLQFANEQVILVKNQEVEEHRMIALYALIIVAILSVLLFVVFRFFRHKKKANDRLTELNEEINAQNEEITQQRDTLESTLEELKTTQDKLVQNEKMASLGRLVSGIAHEVNTPVGVGLTASSFLKDENVLERIL